MSAADTPPFPCVFDSLRTFVQRVAHQIASWGIPQRGIWHYTFGPPGNWTGSTIVIPDPALAFDAIFGSWSAWPEYGRIQQAIENTEAVQRIVLTYVDGRAPAPGDNNLLNAFLHNFMGDYLNEARHVAGLWDEGIFAGLYRQLADSVERNGYRLAVWAPLQRFEVSGLSGETELVEGHYLLEPDDITRDRLRSPYLGQIHLGVSRVYLKTTTRIAYGQPTSFPTPRFPDIATAIRLAVGGEARVSSMAAIPLPGDCRPLAATGWGSGIPSALELAAVNPSRMTPASLPLAAEYARRLPTLEPAYGVALRRFSQTAERLSGDDKLIDATIGLENLLLPGVGEEKTFQFALRGAWLLGNDDVNKRADLVDQGGGPPAQRLVRQPPGHGVAWYALATAAVAPLIGFDDPAGQDRSVGYEALAGHSEPELIEPAELGQVRASEGSVRQVEVFWMGSVRTSIIGRPRRLPSHHPRVGREHAAARMRVINN